MNQTAAMAVEMSGHEWFSVFVLFPAIHDLIKLTPTIPHTVGFDAFRWRAGDVNPPIKSTFFQDRGISLWVPDTIRDSLQ
jgi:hypothetical protein